MIDLLEDHKDVTEPDSNQALGDAKAPLVNLYQTSSSRSIQATVSMEFRSDQRGPGPRAMSLQGQNLDLHGLSEHMSLASLCLWSLVSPYGMGLKQKPLSFFLVQRQNMRWNSCISLQG